MGKYDDIDDDPFSFVYAKRPPFLTFIVAHSLPFLSRVGVPVYFGSYGVFLLFLLCVQKFICSLTIDINVLS